MAMHRPTDGSRAPRHAAAEDSVFRALEACVASMPKERSASQGSPLHASVETVDVLCGCVAEYAKTLRVMGEPPERVLISLKSILGRGVPNTLDADAFKRVAITWCIEAYFAPD